MSELDDNRVLLLRACSALYAQVPEEVANDFMAIVTKFLRSMDEALHPAYIYDKREKITVSLYWQRPPWPCLFEITPERWVCQRCQMVWGDDPLIPPKCPEKENS